MQPNKIEAGAIFPDLMAQSVDGSTIDIGKPAGHND